MPGDAAKEMSRRTPLELMRTPLELVECEGTCVGQFIDSGQFGSIELDGSIGLDDSGKPDGGRALELVENGQFGEENWEVISGDTLGDAGEQRSKAELEGANLDCLNVMVSHEGFDPMVMTTLGSWMAWRSLA
jgi:hypothetical protein